MLAVTESGSGQPLVLLHGWGLHSGVWQSCLLELEKDFHCYRVDMLGYGDSQDNDLLPFSLENMREALSKVINSIDSNEITLLGWSLGGLVAIDYLSHYSDKVKKLVLVASNASFCQQPGWLAAMESSVLENFSQQLEKDYQKTVDKFLALQMFGMDNYKMALKVLKQSIADRAEPSLSSLREGLQVLRNADLRMALSKLKQAVLIIMGSHDRLVPCQASSNMQLLLSSAMIQVIDGAGHAPFISHPDEFLKALGEFSKE